jgi:hypothetical protein
MGEFDTSTGMSQAQAQEQAQGSSRAAENALSAYEKKLSGGLLKKRSGGKSQCNVANDVMQGSLRYIFTVFQ